MKIDVIHKELLDEWRKESKRDLKIVSEILKTAKLEMKYASLIQIWNKGRPKNLNAVRGKLDDLKESFTDMECLSGLSYAALVSIHRDVYEIEALHAILCSNLRVFNEANTLVLSFYESCNAEVSVPNKYLMIGLQLMYYLAINKLPEFHMLLERVEQTTQQQNPYISTPVKLEQSLMEGVYNKIVLTEKTIPSPYYAIFIRILMDTIRDEIAMCMQFSFHYVPLRDAAQLLLFTDQSELLPFAKERGWKLENDMFIFEKPLKTDAKQQVDSERISKQAIFYAKQLEMIV